MALQGTIDSFPLVDVLQLLSSSTKTGRLELVGDRGRGMLWLADGEVVAGSFDDATASDGAEAVWELLRFADGSFEFTAGETAPEVMFTTSVADAVERAEAMIDEWEQIRTRVPSGGRRVRLADELPGADVHLSAEDWTVIVAAGSQHDVDGLLGALGLAEFAGCRQLAELVDRGLLVVGSSELPASAAASSHDAAWAGTGTIGGGPVPPPEAPSQVTDSSHLGAVQAAADDGQHDPTHQPEPLGRQVGHEEPHRDDAPLSQRFPEPHDQRQQPSTDLLDQSDPPPAAAFPEHFPIDDLVAASEGSWEQLPGSHEGSPSPVASPEPTPVAEPHALDTGPAGIDMTGAGLTGADVTGSGAAVPPASARDADDDVLAQIGRLSPKAAEAIAAALGDGGETDH